MKDDKFCDYGTLCLEEARLACEWMECLEESEMTKELREQAKQRLIRASDAYDKHAELMEEAEAKLFDEAFAAHAIQKGKRIATMAGKRKHSRDRRGTRKAQAENHQCKVCGRLYRDKVRKRNMDNDVRRDLMSPGYVYDNHDEYCDGVTRDDSLERWDYRAYQEESMRALYVEWSYDDDNLGLWPDEDPDEFDRRDDPAMDPIFTPTGRTMEVCVAETVRDFLGEAAVEKFMELFEATTASMSMSMEEFISRLETTCFCAKESYMGSYW